MDLTDLKEAQAEADRVAELERRTGQFKADGFSSIVKALRALDVPRMEVVESGYYAVSIIVSQAPHVVRVRVASDLEYDRAGRRWIVSVHIRPNLSFFESSWHDFKLRDSYESPRILVEVEPVLRSRTSSDISRPCYFWWSEDADAGKVAEAALQLLLGHRGRSEVTAISRHLRRLELREKTASTFFCAMAVILTLFALGSCFF